MSRKYTLITSFILMPKILKINSLKKLL